MPKNSPKSTEEKIERMINAWRTLAPDKSFGGMTLAQFEALAAPAFAARRRLDEIEHEREQTLAARERADDAINEAAKRVVDGVRADPTEGTDSALYAGFGYTRESDYKSGLHRATTKKPSDT
jgi:hypothetical protein